MPFPGFFSDSLTPEQFYRFCVYSLKNFNSGYKCGNGKQDHYRPEQGPWTYTHIYLKYHVQQQPGERPACQAAQEGRQKKYPKIAPANQYSYMPSARTHDFPQRYFLHLFQGSQGNQCKKAGSSKQDAHHRKPEKYRGYALVGLQGLHFNLILIKPII